MAILLDKACDLSPFTDDKSSRYALGSVHYKDGQLTASNGRMMVRVPVKESEKYPDTPGSGNEPGECLIPAKFLKDNVAKGGKIRSRNPVLCNARLTVTDDSQVVMSTTDCERSSDEASRQAEGRYPDCNQIVPTDEPTLEVHFNADLLLLLAKHAAAFAVENKGARPMKFSFIDGDRAVKVTYQLDDGREALAVVMPCRQD